MKHIFDVSKLFLNKISLSLPACKTAAINRIQVFNRSPYS